MNKISKLTRMKLSLKRFGHNVFSKLRFVLSNRGKDRFYNQLNKLAQEGNYQAVIDIYQASPAKKNPKISLVVGYSYYQLTIYDHAYEMLQEAVIAQPNDYLTNLFLASTLEYLDQPSEALKHYIKSLKHGVGDPSEVLVPLLPLVVETFDSADQKKIFSEIESILELNFQPAISHLALVDQFKSKDQRKSFFSHSIKEDIIRVETYFPQEKPSGFTNAETNFLLKSMSSLVAYRPYIMMRKGGVFAKTLFGTTQKAFDLDKMAYSTYYEGQTEGLNTSKIKFLTPDCKLEANLALTTFLDQTFVLAPFFKKMKIPFVFNLYAGGSFGLGNGQSDYMLRDIFANKYFRKVIVNNEVVKDYLVTKNFCPANKIEYVFGVPVQFERSELSQFQKRCFPKNKSTFDICFVAFRYDSIGLSKGYDLFVEAGKMLLNDHLLEGREKIQLHVIGNYDASIIDVKDIETNITFHGVRPAKWLQEFYHDMDIVVAPNRRDVFYPGSFDGYPMCPEQSLCGVAMFQSDELNINRNFSYYKEDEIVHIKLDSKDIKSKIEYYFKNIEELYRLAKKGKRRTQKLFDLEKRSNEIKKILLAAKGNV